MSNKSDHAKNSIHIQNLLPDVFNSPVSEAWYESTIDRTLSKDDTVHVSGHIGVKNQAALQSRRIAETNPHIDAFQLEPVMQWTFGPSTEILTFENFLSKLDNLGVSIADAPEWGNVQMFNYAPPINIDMLINYADYYWVTSDGSVPQYYTIENPCRKAQSKADVFSITLAQKGATTAALDVNVIDNTFTVPRNYDEMITDGFIIGVENSRFLALNNRTFTITSTSVTTSDVILHLEEPIAGTGSVLPSEPTKGDWFLLTPANQLFEFNGTDWTQISLQSGVGTIIDFSYQLTVYQQEASCVCNAQLGWDNAPWDDNQLDTAPWIDSYLTAITYRTEAEWIAANGNPVDNSQWFDTTADEIKVYSILTSAWKTVISQFSRIRDQYTGNNHWDQTLGCAVQQSNPWSTQNGWMHRTQLTSYAGAIRAQLPIIEFSSTILFTEWTRKHKVWKYRENTTVEFGEVSNRPLKIELIPIKDFLFVQTQTGWTLFLGGPEDTTNINLDLTDVFKSGYKFKVVDDNFNTFVLTVQNSTFRQITPTDPTRISGFDKQWITVVDIEETLYFGPVTGGTPDRIRIEPIVTSIGDEWRGYHIHWLLTESTVDMPIESIDTSWIPQSVPVIESTPDGDIVVGSNYQELITSNPLNQIELHDNFRYNPLQPLNTFVSGTNDIRVFVNDVELIYSYEFNLIYEQNPIDYIVVGNNTYDYTNLNNHRESVQYITFVNTIPARSTVRIVVGPLALRDNGYGGLPVRTIEDDSDFGTAVSLGNQPIFTSLVEDAATPQIKDAINQNPYFNIYDVVTGSVIGTSPIFTYVEDPAYPVNPNIQRRLKTESTDEWFFKQHLLDENTGEMYAYHVTSNDIFTWVNPDAKTIKEWNRTFYTANIKNIDGNGYEKIVHQTFSDQSPLNSEEGDLWFNINTEILYVYKNSSWVEHDNYKVSIANPLLRTIWRPGKNKETYTPKIVNRNGDVPTAEDTVNDISWQTFDQWYFNIDHDNREELKYSQLFTHFNSILQAQPAVAGLIGGGRYTYAQEDINYGLGGTIKDHNDSFDELVSASISHVSPPTLIEFAQNQYKAALSAIETLVKLNFQQLNIERNIQSATTELIADVIAAYESNNFNIRIYGDSTSEGSGDGIKYWIATLPNLGLLPLTEPMVLELDDHIEIVHHDGHMSTIMPTPAELDKIYRTLTIDAANGKVSNTLPPTTLNDWLNNFNNPLHALWYNRTSRKLYTLDLVAIQSNPPAFTNINEGAYYYNTTSDTVYVYTTTGWTPTSNIGGNVAIAVAEINFAKILASTVYAVEQQLWLGSKDAYNKLKNFSIPTTQLSVVEYERYSRFLSYCNSESIVDPMENSGYSDTDAFTWNYAYSLSPTLPNNTVTYTPVGYWKYIYEQLFNTEYPHLEPWKLQKYQSKPDWWDINYKSTSRKWNSTMWTNIMNGNIPSGVRPPDWNIPTYTYVPVNISNTTTTSGYLPDDLLPPYFAPEGVVRSVFDNYSNIQMANADYVYGSGSQSEWLYKTSMEYNYDTQIINFTTQPMRYLHYAFGPDYVYVDDLNIDRETKQVYSHRKVRFHGDAASTTENYKVRGLNQWYVNYNRHSGFDTGSDFKTTWTTWLPKLAYQTSSIVDTTTLDVFNKYFDLTSLDYTMDMYNTGTIEQKWADGLTATVTNVPTYNQRYNNQEDWKFVINACYGESRTITVNNAMRNYFDVTSTGAILMNAIEPIAQSTSTITLSRNWTKEFAGLTSIEVKSTTGTYINVALTAVVYDNLSKTTILTVNNNIPSIEFVKIPNVVTYEFETGTQIMITSEMFMPTGVTPDQYYFICRDANADIRLAESYNDAISGIYITTIKSTSKTKYKWRMGQIKTTFRIYGGQGSTNQLWTHYELDTTTKTIQTPYTVNSMQDLIDFIDGYDQQTNNNGIVTGDGEYAEFETDTGRLISWKSEQERFIFWAYALRRTGIAIKDRYAVSVLNVSDKLWTFTDNTPLANNTPVKLITTGSLPQGTISGVTYYVTNVRQDHSFTLSVVPNGTNQDIVDPVDLGSGQLSLIVDVKTASYPTFEMNPMKTSMVITTPVGFIENVLQTKVVDSRINQSVFDQNGHPISIDKFHVVRRDKETRFMLLPDVTNIHFGGARLKIDMYQHVLVFNNYTITGSYIYDPYIGMNVNRFTVDFFRAAERTMRPNLGGYMLYNGKFIRNVEGTIADMSTYYSAYDQISQTKQSDLSKQLLDYEGQLEFLDYLNVTPSSHFTFYRGMLQSKGSTASITAYINSKRFIDAKVDEFWAWKIGEFGSALPQTYPEFNLTAQDGTKDDIRWYFDDSIPTDYVKARFEGIELDD